MNNRIEVTESTATKLVLVKDEAGNEFICDINALKQTSSVSEDEKKNCIHNVPEYYRKNPEGK